MRQRITIVAMLLAVAVSFGLYRLELHVQDMERRLAQADERLREDQRTIRILKAEWSYLNQPARLQNLAERHLLLAPLSPQQINTLSALPLRPVDQGNGEFGDADHGFESLPLPGVKPVRQRPSGGIIVASTGALR
ncbi:MAG: hypothetical protein QF578_16060 [Alphaproteobacteria bacterium]|jgi:hypothetical protein|nr:hypothetical protein [Alphaproteobacteria bacterium]MDP6566343.1 hypothetical protein [Alphaproteobacteria bacterium]MDP6812503.1 hypothetical protein [Alphaproteobacteria bacterium]